VLAIQERKLGPEHPETLRSRNNLAEMLRMQDRKTEAEAEHRKVLALRERVLGTEHPEVAGSCYNLALCLEAQAEGAEAKAKKAEALPLARHALAVWKRTLGERHLQTQRAQVLVLRLEKK
jgi:hypothetical protein